MHMADALVSPVVGGVFWALSSTLIGWSAKKITEENDPKRTPLMGVLGAFILAAQMINFSIPGTGSSGHLGGGLLLAALLGPHRAFITLSSVLIIQSLFLADGGVLALGCNMFNIAFFPVFIAYPFFFRPLAGAAAPPFRLAAASMIAATAGLLLGASSVVVQTTLSGISELPFSTFLLFMLPIHLAIGMVEGMATWAVLSFILNRAPALLTGEKQPAIPPLVPAAVAIAALLTVTLLSPFASSAPDGLEWSIKRTGKTIAVQGKSEPGTPASAIAGATLLIVAAGGAGLALRRSRRERSA